LIKKTKKIGILGGTFDPCHIGHLKISKEAKKKFNLEKVIWTITKKNPFKNESNLSLENRIKISKKFTKKYKFIQIHHYEKRIRSNKTIDLINYLKKKFINKELYLLIGADNLIKFHRWKKWKDISIKCNILVFDRYPYKSKALKSLAFKHINKEKLKFINFKKVNISSSQLKKI
jgi:nicotinate-nucleotide adenylyltransferase|tara:strand:- start:2999 stop:3523 length:525 start_codon:yes stop_codon:yes gene_type:complete